MLTPVPEPTGYWFVLRLGMGVSIATIGRAQPASWPTHAEEECEDRL